MRPIDIDRLMELADELQDLNLRASRAFGSTAQIDLNVQIIDKVQEIKELRNGGKCTS